MSLLNSGRLWRVLLALKNTCSEPTRTFLSRKFLRRAIKLGKKAAFWERAALDYDPTLTEKLRGDR